MMLPDRLRSARRVAGLTTGALGKKLGFSQAAISLWENGLREPGPAQRATLIAFIDAHSGEALLKRAAELEKKIRSLQRKLKRATG